MQIQFPVESRVDTTVLVSVPQNCGVADKFSSVSKCTDFFKTKLLFEKSLVSPCNNKKRKGNVTV